MSISELRNAALRLLAAACLAGGLSACHGGQTSVRSGHADWSEQALAGNTAEQWERSALRSRRSRAASQAVACALRAQDEGDQARIAGNTSDARDADALAARCTRQAIEALLAANSGRLDDTMAMGSHSLAVSVDQASPWLQFPLRARVAADVPLGLFGGQRYVRVGRGVPLAVVGPRCGQTPPCSHFPPEGVFRPITAVLERGAGNTPTLVLRDPTVANRGRHDERAALAEDLAASYALGLQRSPIRRIGVWSLLGGREVGRREGIYLLQDYDPDKRVVLMIHGLGSHPAIWAKLSASIWADPVLREQYQVWHAVYRTDAPMLIIRLRLARSIAQTVQALDATGMNLASQDIVLVGHSLGGVLSRMLAVEDQTKLWDAAFLSPWEALKGEPQDLAVVRDTFRIRPVDGVTRVIALAAPHQGSPTAESWIGRAANLLLGGRSTELRSLQRVARANPESVRPELLETYLEARINTISTLQRSQPVRVAAARLAPRTPLHSIAGDLGRDGEPSDGVVPVESAIFPGSESALVVRSGHDVHLRQDAIEEVLRILADHQARAPRRVSPPAIGRERLLRMGDGSESPAR